MGCVPSIYMKKSVSSNIAPSIKELLRPVVRLCLRRSLKIQDILLLLKECFVEVASEELAREGHEANISRISVVSGLQRKDIIKLNQSDNTKSSHTNLLTKLIGQWQQNREFSKPIGTPRPLTFEGNESEFATLVRTISTDVNPYTVLFELERTNQVKKDGKFLKLLSAVYEVAGSKKLSEAFSIVGRECNDLFSAVEQNILTTCEVPNLHLRTEFDNICVDALPKIRAWVLDKGTTLHEEARAYLAQFDKDSNPRLFSKDGGAKVALSAFSLTGDATSKADLKERDKK